MRYTRLGSSGPLVSRICLGMMSYGAPPEAEWMLDERAAEPIVRRAVDAGVTFFDTADMYSDGASEELTGRLLRRLFARREDYVLATKVYWPTGSGPNERGLSRKHVMAAIDASLRRLGVDHVDLYQIHRWDYDTPIDETMAALDDVVRAGKALHIGASATYAWQFTKAQFAARANGWTGFVSMQNRYNLAYREEEREMIPCCLDQRVGILPYSPLAQGMLAGNRDRAGRHTTRARGARGGGHDDADFAVVDGLRAVACGRGLPPARIALAWLLGRPGVSAPVVGATRPAHVDDAVAALDLTLSDEEVAVLEAPYRPHPVLGHS